MMMCKDDSVKIDNVFPNPQFLTKLKKVKNDKSFFPSEELSEEIIKNMPSYNWIGYTKESQAIGGFIDRKNGVIAHRDYDEHTNYTIVWFPQVFGCVIFFVGDKLYNIKSGDVIVFNHNLVHGVSIETTGKFVFASCFCKVSVCND